MMPSSGGGARVSLTYDISLGLAANEVKNIEWGYPGELGAVYMSLSLKYPHQSQNWRPLKKWDRFKGSRYCESQTSQDLHQSEETSL